MRSSSIRRFALLAAVAIALCGCGGESGLSADGLAQRPNAICARYQPIYRKGAAAHTGIAIVRLISRPAGSRSPPAMTCGGFRHRFLTHMPSSSRTTAIRVARQIVTSDVLACTTQPGRYDQPRVSGERTVHHPSLSDYRERFVITAAWADQVKSGSRLDVLVSPSEPRTWLTLGVCESE